MDTAVTQTTDPFTIFQDPRGFPNIFCVFRFNNRGTGDERIFDNQPCVILLQCDTQRQEQVPSLAVALAPSPDRLACVQGSGMGTVLGRDGPAPMTPPAEEAPPAVVPLDKEEGLVDPDQYESPPGLPVRAEPACSARTRAAAVAPERRRSERLESMRRVRTRTVTRGGLDRAPGRECRARARFIFLIICLLFSGFSAGYVRLRRTHSVGLRPVLRPPVSRDLPFTCLRSLFASDFVAAGDSFIPWPRKNCEVVVHVVLRTRLSSCNKATVAKLSDLNNLNRNELTSCMMSTYVPPLMYTLVCNIRSSSSPLPPVSDALLYMYGNTYTTMILA